MEKSPNNYIMIVTIAATLSGTSDLPILFFKITTSSSVSLYSSVTDLYYRMILSLTTLSKTNIPELLNVAGQENTLAILLLKSENVGNVYEIQDYTDSPGIATVLFSGAIHIDASMLKCFNIFLSYSLLQSALLL